LKEKLHLENESINSWEFKTLQASINALSALDFKVGSKKSGL
jgi:hypothetical protein